MKLPTGLTKGEIKSEIKSIKYDEILDDDLENYNPIEFGKKYKAKPKKIKKVKINIIPKIKGYCLTCIYYNTEYCFIKCDENYNPLEYCKDKVWY